MGTTTQRPRLVCAATAATQRQVPRFEGTRRLTSPTAMQLRSLGCTAAEDKQRTRAQREGPQLRRAKVAATTHLHN